MGGNGLIVSFGEVMPMRLGRLQRQNRRAFRASAVLQVSPQSLLAGVGRRRRTSRRAPPPPSRRTRHIGLWRDVALDHLIVTARWTP